MRALVVYESMFGNTRDLAVAIAEGLTARGARVDVLEVDAAPVEFADRVDLLVVGAPTHAFGLPKQQTRADAARRIGTGELVSRGCGVREWVDRVRLDKGQPTAAFDTKVDRPRLPGSAARAAARRLRDQGAAIIGTQTFRVVGVEGPLMDGEAGHARAWASGLLLDAAIHRVG
jgi:Flavodoxin